MIPTQTEIPTFPTTEGDLPAFVFPADHELPVAETVEPGRVVAIYSRGRYRAARVVKVGPKRAQVRYTTVGAREAAETVASIDRVAQVKAARRYDAATRERYLAWAETIERLAFEPTAGRPGYDAFVPISSLPVELQELERQSGSRNAARTTIVYSPAQYREWAAALAGSAERDPERLAAAAVEMARPAAERIADATHVTTKSVALGEVYAVA
jgi:hypothetical protein